MAEKTRMDPDWIKRVWERNPCVKLDNGNIRMGPCRAAFVNILSRPKPGEDGKEKSYGAVLLIPDFSIIGQAAIKPLQDEVMALFNENAKAALSSPEMFARFHNPFKKQETFVDMKNGGLYDGFVPGRFCISANSSQSQPVAVDQNLAPITDKSRLYSGCWVIPSVRGGWINRPEKKGPTFYLQSVMVVADDEDLGGSGSSNPQVDFGGVQIDASVNPADAFGMGATAGGPAPVNEINLFG